MVGLFASNYEILVKTEPFLKFKKLLFKEYHDFCKGNEEKLRRKFYKILDSYLQSNGVPKVKEKELKESGFKFLIKKLNERFKQKKQGSFIKQGLNVGYINEEKSITWIRYMSEENSKEITAFL